MAPITGTYARPVDGVSGDRRDLAEGSHAARFPQPRIRLHPDAARRDRRHSGNMATALQPRLVAAVRPPATRRAHGTARTNPGAARRARRAEYALAACARCCSDRVADRALVLDGEALRGRTTLLKAERSETAHLLEDLARNFQVKAWLSDLEIPAWNTNRLLGLPEGLEACVFDLEDVLTGSPSLHVAAWSETFNALSSERGGPNAAHFAPFDPRLDYYAHLHARPRLEGVRAFLTSRGISLPEGEPDDPPGCETVHSLANLKQRALLRRLNAGRGLSAFAGSRRYLQLAHRAGLRNAAFSASANTQTILAHTASRA